jgi:hypothetical protein
MDTISASDAARRLGTSLPRVQRAIDRLGLAVERRPGGRVRLGDQELTRLRAELGVTPSLDGLAGSRRRCWRRLLVHHAGWPGLVRREREWVAAGRAREVELVRANVTAPEWPSLAPRLANLRPPARQHEPRNPGRLPARLRHLFWNADPSRLDLDAHGGYIAERLLSSHDLDGIAWAASALTAHDWDQAACNRGLTAAERALAHNLARAARR